MSLSSGPKYPLGPSYDDQDDFIRTISDNESIGQASDVDDSNADDSIPRGKKRKHRETNGSEQSQSQRDGKGSLERGSGQSSRKNKKKSKKGDDHLDQEATSLDEGRSDTSGGQEEEEMNSDFEFQVADLENGLTDELNVWDDDEKAGPNTIEAESGRKRGVDIDELVARQRARTSKSDSGKKAQFDEGQVQSGSEDEDDHLSENGSHVQNGNFQNGVNEQGEDDFISLGSDDLEADMDDEDDDDDEAEDYREESTSESESEVADDMPDSADSEDDDAPFSKHQKDEEAKRAAFFAPEEATVATNDTRPARDTHDSSFENFSLSRPILRGLTSLGFTTPTPIQQKTIPIALMGKDVVGGAVTGSGKTAAFLIPIIERLLYRPKKVPTSRVAILMPTRELAVQCFQVAKKLASYTDITLCQLVGGFSLREQEAVLRGRPDIIIATPGRFIDHMRNSASFTVDTLEILVLDEADRMLEDGFADELNEILTTIPRNRQTMLFSATMTDSVDKLIRVGLQKPVRLMVDARKQTVGTLTQEFVRLRPGREGMRLGYLLHLCQDIYTDRVIVFFRQKAEAHRVRIIFALLGIKAAELHGSMSQEQRIAAITTFTSRKATHLLATDLASRGLDIPSVSTVLNYTAPQSHEIYLHRVGRTARAGRAGRACTLAAEPDRKVVKEAVRSGKSQGAKIISRTVESQIVDEWMNQIEQLEPEIEMILKEEKAEKLLNQSDMRIRKGENLMDHEAEIKSRPKRTWFESEREKLLAKKKGMIELNGDVGLQSQSKRKKSGKLSGKEMKALDDRRERVEGRVWKKGKEDVANSAPQKKSKGKGKGIGADTVKDSSKKRPDKSKTSSAGGKPGRHVKGASRSRGSRGGGRAGSKRGRRH